MNILQHFVKVCATPEHCREYWNIQPSNTELIFWVPKCVISFRENRNFLWCYLRALALQWKHYLKTRCSAMHEIEMFVGLFCFLERLDCHIFVKTIPYSRIKCWKSISSQGNLCFEQNILCSNSNWPYCNNSSSFLVIIFCMKYFISSYV